MNNEVEKPISLKTIVGMSGMWIANPAFAGQSAIEPILTLNLVGHYPVDTTRLKV